MYNIHIIYSLLKILSEHAHVMLEETPISNKPSVHQLS